MSTTGGAKPSGGNTGSSGIGDGTRAGGTMGNSSRITGGEKTGYGAGRTGYASGSLKSIGTGMSDMVGEADPAAGVWAVRRGGSGAAGLALQLALDSTPPTHYDDGEAALSNARLVHRINAPEPVVRLASNLADMPLVRPN